MTYTVDHRPPVGQLPPVGQGPPVPPPRPAHYRLAHVVRSEALKVLTLRSNAMILGLTVVAGPLVTGLVANANLHHNPGYYIGFDPTQNSLVGLIVAGLTGGVFGSLLITSEYASGTIRASMAATPRRPMLLAAKIGVAAAITVLFCEILSFVSFFLGQAVLSGGGAPSASLGSPGALRAVVMTGVFIALLALPSFGFGLILRSTAGAIADLRDLARGIHPPALDTGLENALTTLAARSPVPTEVSVSIPTRPGPSVEAICYFCAAELLANVAQHSQASHASLSCTQHGPWLRIVVRDNGRGGATLNRASSSSSGLAGLGDRVGAVDGHLSIASPPGGPTTITVDLPVLA
jgi:ABC-2 family transporter protein